MPSDFDVHKKVIEVARKLIDEEIDYVEGARFINDNRFELTDIDESIFYFFIALVSETETMPDRDNRKRFSKAYLSRSDKRKEEYYPRISKELKESCLALLDKMKLQSP